MALQITITEADFSEYTRRGAFKRKAGWDSQYMEAVRQALIHYHQGAADDEPGNRNLLTGALYEWKHHCPREFNKGTRSVTGWSENCACNAVWTLIVPGRPSPY